MSSVWQEQTQNLLPALDACLAVGRFSPSSWTPSDSQDCCPATGCCNLLSCMAQCSQLASEAFVYKDRNENCSLQLPASLPNAQRDMQAAGAQHLCSPLSSASPPVRGSPAAADTDSKYEAQKGAGKVNEVWILDWLSSHVLPRESAGTFRSSSNCRPKNPNIQVK